MLPEDGGPAFGTNGMGMTLRDWFAGQALAGMMTAAPLMADKNTPADLIAGGAYAIADAMLKARKS